MASNAWIDYYKTRENYYGKRLNVNYADHIISSLEIQKEDIVLDIGCGPGAYLEHIKQKINSSCFGIDISPDAVVKRSKKNLAVADMRYLPFKCGTFTKIFSLGTIEHAPETRIIVEEIFRVLKIRGKLFLNVPNKFSFFHITKNIKKILGKWDLGYEKSFTPKQLITELKSAGLFVTDYFIIPHPKTSNLFNVADNILNKISNKLFGFFLCVLAGK